MLSYQFGDIVLVEMLLDPQGRNAKNRPALVIRSRVNEEWETIILVMAITTLIPDPLPDDHFPLPWSRPYHPRTGLSKRCAAVGYWQANIDPTRVLRSIGTLTGRSRKAVAVWLAARDPKE